MSLYFTADIDEKKFNRKINTMQSNVRRLGTQVTKEADKMTNAFIRVSQGVGAISTGIAGAELARTIVNVRGEVQQLQLTYNTLIGDVVKGQNLMKETIQFAATTPFNLQQVATGAKQLLVYGVGAEKVIDELTMLGDVAAGTKVPLGDLIYLYGTLKTQGRALAIDIRQFAGRGIPIYRELAKVMGTTEQDILKLVERGLVGFAQVQAAFQNMTREGGAFNNLMKDLATTVTGRLSNLQDAVYMMWNEIGARQEGVIYASIEGLHALVANYETVLKILGQLVVAYGTYRAALMAVAATDVAKTMIPSFVENIRLIRMMRKEIGLLNSIQQAFNITVSKNPYVWIPALLAAVGGLIVSWRIWKKDVSDTQAEMEKLAEANQTASSNFEPERGATLQLLNDVRDINLSYNLRVQQLEKLKAIVPEYLGQLTKEGILINDNTEAIYDYLAAQEKQIRLDAFEDMTKELYALQVEQKKTTKEAEAMYKALSQPTSSSAEPIINISKIWEDRQLAKAKAEWDAAIAAENNTNEELKKLNDERKKILESSTGVVTTPPTLSKDEIEKRANEYNDAVLAADKDLYNEQNDLARARLSDEIDLIRLEKDLKIAAINEEKQAYIDLALAAGQAGSAADVDTSVFTKRIETATAAAAVEEKKVYSERKKEQDEANAELLKDQADAHKALLQEVATYEQKRQALIEEYAAKRAAMYEVSLGDDGQEIFTLKEGFVEENVQQLEKQLNTALKELDIDNLSALQFAFGEVVRMSKGQLSEALDILKDKLESLTDPEQIIEFIKQINKIQDALDAEISPALEGSFEDAIRAAIRQLQLQEEINDAKERGVKEDDLALRNLQGELERTETIKKRALAGSIVTSFTDTLSSTVEKMQELADATGDVDLSRMVGQLSVASSLLSATAQGLVSGGPIGGAIGLISSLASQIGGTFGEAKSQLLQSQMEINKFSQQVKLMQLQIDATDWENAFGVDQAGKATAAVLSYYKAVAEYQSLLNKDLERPELEFKKSQFGYTSESLAMMDAYERGLNELEGMLVKTVDRNPFSEWFLGLEDQFVALVDYAPELWDSEGMFDVAAAELFLQTSTKLTQAQKDQIQALIDTANAAEDAKGAFKDYLSSTFGELGTGAIDAVTSAIMDQSDAWVNYGDTVANVIQKVVEDIGYQLFMAKDLENLESVLEGIYGDASLSGQDKVDKVNEALAAYYANAGNNLDALQEFLKENSEYWKEQGVNLYESDDTTREGMTGVTKNAATQESVDEWNAKLTTLLAQADWIQYDTSSLVNYATQTKAYQEAMLIQVTSVNTMLAELDKKYNFVQTTLQKIDTTGIKIRN